MGKYQAINKKMRGNTQWKLRDRNSYRAQVMYFEA